MLFLAEVWTAELVNTGLKNVVGTMSGVAQVMHGQADVAIFVPVINL